MGQPTCKRNGGRLKDQTSLNHSPVSGVRLKGHTPNLWQSPICNI